MTSIYSFSLTDVNVKLSGIFYSNLYVPVFESFVLIVSISLSVVYRGLAL